MPNWVHRTTKVYSRSIASADLPEAQANYIEEPDLSAVVGFENKYWKVNGDLVELMTPAERTAVDDAIAAALNLEDRAEAVTRASLDITTRELVEVLLFEINKCNTRIQEIQDVFVAQAGTSTLAALRNQIPNASPTTNPEPATFTEVSPKTRGQVLQKYVDDINAGASDP